MAACGVFEMTEPRVVEAMRILTVANDVVNYVCRDHVQGTQSFVVSFLLRPVPTANAGLATVSSSCATTQSTFTSASLAYVGLHNTHHTLARQCESVVRATIKVNGEGQILTHPRHP